METLRALAEKLRKCPRKGHPWDEDDIRKSAEYQAVVDLPSNLQPDMAVVLSEIIAPSGVLNLRNRKLSNGEGMLLKFALAALLRRKQSFTESQLIHLCKCMGKMNLAWYGPNPPAYFVPTLKRFLNNHDLSPEIEEACRKLQRFWQDSGKDGQKLARKLQEIVAADEAPDLPLVRNGEVFATQMLDDIEAMSEEDQTAWAFLLAHANNCEPSAPNKKWLKEAESLFSRIPKAKVSQAFQSWLPLINKPAVNPEQRSVQYQYGYTYTPDPHSFIAPHLSVLKGMAWFTGLIDDPALTRVVGAAGVSAFRKVPGIGPRATRLGNACIWALGNLGSDTALAQLALMKVKVKFGTAQKSIEKALSRLAERLGISPEDIEEMSVPEYGLSEVGLHEETFGDYTAVLEVVGRKPQITFRNPDGKPMKSVPAAIKKDHAENLKELRGSAKDLEKMLSAQRERLDNLFVLRKTWPLALWKERYLDHHVVGILARRLIWTFDDGGTKTDAFWFDGALRRLDGRALDEHGDLVVSLWHPVDAEPDDIVAWRRWLFEHLVQQPFKQAHREIYLLTEAERNTRVYSNRFASHVLKQHQFNSLCAVRGWKNRLRLMVDDSYPPAFKNLPDWGLRAEFWIEGIGTDYSDEYVVDSGAFRYLSTDQVRFYTIDAEQVEAHAGGGGYGTRYMGVGSDPIAIEQVPKLVLSEILRDVDLFVGVTSVGNDPNWSDGGPEGHYLDYWHAQSFGELGETANTRKEILTGLLPRLKIASVARIDGRFLRVTGKRREYKIHLGSGNILMEPNDQYLCIVKAPSRSKGDDKLFLPFEGDDKLSVILSKAFLLAADDKITDSTITTQIKSRR